MKTRTLIASFILSLFLFTELQAQYKVGDVVTDFSLKNVDNKNVSLAQYPSAKGFIVVFTCNSCPVAIKYESRVEQLNKDFSAKAYPVIAISSNDIKINPDDSFEKMQKKAKDEAYSYPYLYDESQAVAKQFGATNTPHVYVVAKEGDKMVVKYIGAIDNNADNASKADKKYVSDAVNSLIDGKDIAVTATKAIGCSIKWKKS
ncbi:MAG: thioredoxin family protein [Bacteroidota bacterium]|nr:thioredoxin family protein [Bacteroidota bacterium]